jgi:hypothetical protein
MKSNASAILLIVALLAALVALNFVFFVDTRDASENEESADRSSYRTTPYGTRAFYTLLEEGQYPVTRLEKPFTEITERDQIGTLVVIAPPDTNNPTEEEFQSLNEWMEAGGLLVVIDREIRADFGEARADTRPGNPKSTPGFHPLQPTLFTRGVEYVKPSQYATRITLNSRTAVYHIGDEQGALLADAKVERGRVVLLTDPYIVANNGIRDADNVILALNLFAARPEGRIAFDEYHHGYGSSIASGGVMSYLRGTPVPWMMAQAGLIAALVVYTFGRRFARPIPVRQEPRTTNLEFVSSMANITRLARASDLAMQNIYSEFRKRLCRFSGMPAKVDDSKLAAGAARRAKLDEAELARLLARCDRIARGDEVSDAELLALVRRMREIESQIGP